MQRVMLLGYFGACNFGDDALLVDFLHRHGAWLAGQHLGIDVLSSGGELCHGFIDAAELDALPLRPLTKREALRAAPRGYRALIAPGGSMLQDASSLRSLLYYLWQIERFAAARVPVYLLHQGLGPFNTWLGQKLTPHVLRHCRLLSVRDEDSHEWADAHTRLRQHSALELACDPVLAGGLQDYPQLTPPPAVEAAQERFALVLPRPTGDLPTPRDKTAEADALAQLLRQVRELTQLTPMLYPLQSSCDAAFCAEVVERADGCAAMLQLAAEEPYPNSAVWQLIAQAGLVLSYRLHGLVCAAARGVPALGVAYDPKVSAFCDEISYPYCYPATVHEPETFALFEQYWQDRAQHMAELERRRGAMRVRLERSSLRFRELW